jgi:hypothetical protein
MPILTAAQLAASSSAVYTTNGANAITAALVRPFNNNWISSSILVNQHLSQSFVLTGSAQITGSLGVTGSVAILGSVLVSNNVVASEFYADAAFYTNTIYSRSAGTITMSPTDATIFTTLLDAKAKITATGSVIMTGSFIVTGSAQSNVVSQSVASSTASIDSRAGNSWFIQLPASSTTFFNFTNLLEGQTGNIIVSGSSAGTASFSSNVKQVSGSGYNNSTVGGIDVLSFNTWNNNVYLVNSKRFV